MRKDVIIIAEAGVNHNGDIQVAKKVIDVAVDADYLKPQTFVANHIL
jgi:N,N'-diacetyllegionaminate synthase